MAFVEPTGDNTTLIDSFTRADGAVYAGAGATIWDTESFPGSGSNPLAVVSNAMKTGVAEAWGSTILDREEIAFLIEVKVPPGANPDYLAFGWDVVDSTHLYKLIINDATWTAYYNNTQLDTSGQPVLEGGADQRILVIHTAVDGLEIYRETDGVWDQTPILDVAAVSAPLTGGVQAFNFQSTGSTAIEQFSELDLSGPADPVTMYVDADHVASSDAYTRVQASDPSTPFKTVLRAANVAVSNTTWLTTGTTFSTPDGDIKVGDQIVIVSAADANPEDVVDTSVYDNVFHIRDNFGDGEPELPFGNNDGNAPIVVRGATPDFTVKWLGPSGRFFQNWIFQDLMIGYEPDEDPEDPLEVRTRNQFGQAKDLTFRRCWFTRGGFEILACSGTILIDECVTDAPLPPNAIASDGRGFGIGYLPDYAEGAEGTGLVHFRRCLLQNIHGNDCIQAGMGAFDDTGSHLLIEECIFWNVFEGAGFEDFFHCDGVQLQGGHRVTITRSAFFGCSDALICSDYRNSQVTVEGCLVVSHGGQFQMQGYDNFIFRHNTVIHLGTFGRDVSILFYTREGGTDLKFTCENNIMNALWYLHESARNHHVDSVIENNIVILEQGLDTGFGTHLVGVPEYGTSERTADYPTTLDKFPGLTLDGAYELANTIVNPAIGAGKITSFISDIQERLYGTPPDVGAFQNDPDEDVTPAARPPIVLARRPSSGQLGVATSVSPEIDFYPKPGEELDEATVISSTLKLQDTVRAVAIPAQLAIGEVDEDGVQTVTLNPKSSLSPLEEGRLKELVSYTVVLDGVADTEGSEAEAESYQFTTAHPSGAAIEPAVDGSWEGYNAAAFARAQKVLGR